MSRYVKKADRLAHEMKAKLEAGLHAIADDSNSTRDQRLEALAKIADLRIAEQRAEARTGPLKEITAEQSKRIRAMKAELELANAQAIDARNKVESFESERQALATELAGEKGDNVKLAAMVRTFNEEKQSAVFAETQMKKKLEALCSDVAKLRFSVATLANIVNPSESYIREMFFKFFGRLSPEAFIGLGWTQEKLDKWMAYYERVSGVDHKSLIDRLHRSSCCCAQQNPDLHKLPEEDADFVTAFLTFRGVDVSSEVRTLAAAHQDEWFRKNRVGLTFTPPLSHRQITPIAGAQIARWGEDVR